MFTVTGYSNSSFTSASATALTYKSSVANVPNPPGGNPAEPAGERGFGENSAPGIACSDTFGAPECEIAGTTAVTLTSTDPIDDLFVGSVQSGENFQIWAGDSLANLTKFGGNYDVQQQHGAVRN